MKAPGKRVKNPQLITLNLNTGSDGDNDPTRPLATMTTQSAVEDWTIQNRSGDNHEFHLHRTHFLLLERNGIPLPLSQRQYLDMVNVPFWKGKGPYPSV